MTATGAVPGGVAVRLLGPVVVEAAGRPVPVGPPRHRAVLAALALAPGRPRGVDELVGLLWEGRPPPTAPTMVHSAVAGLRRALQPVAAAAGLRLVTQAAGYALDLGSARLDVADFERLLTEGRGLVDRRPAAAADRLGAALDLWRGSALADVDAPFAAVAVARWDELRLECTEERVEALLLLGRADEVVADLADLVLRHPLRERLWAQLARALYRTGRQGEALERLRAARRLLATELGIEPGPELRRVERAVLRHEEPDGGRALPRGAVPASFDAFVGRGRELADVGRALAGSRLVTLTGPGGSGKSRLALELGHSARAAGTEVWWVDLARLRTPELVPEAVADVLQLRTVPGQPPVRTIAAALAHREALVVLDTCEHLADACATLAAGLLSAVPSLRLLATSREALRLAGERVVPVGPLHLAAGTDADEDVAACEAVQLFLTRLTAANPATDVDVRRVLDICRRLDGLPLALELAAGRAADMPLADLADRLDDRFGVLDSAVRSGDVRHRSLSATVGWSHDLLPAPERLLLSRIAVFPGSFTAAAVTEVAATGELSGEDDGLLLARLVASSCVQREDDATGTRYRLLETTREYARARLDRPALAELRQRHARRVLAVVEAAAPHLLGPASPPWLVRLRSEHDDVRAALEWSSGPDGDARLGARLVTGLWHPWDVRGIRDEGLHWVRATLARTGPDLPLLSAGALFSLGRAEFAAVAGFAGRQLDLARQAADDAWAGDALRMLAAVAWAQGRHDQARHRYEDALAASTAGDDGWRAALAAAQLGRLHRDRSEPDAARAALRQAVARADEVGEPVARGLAADVLASVELRWGEPAAARRLADRALEHYRSVGYVEGEASALHLAGRIELTAGAPGRAREAFLQALDLHRRIGHRGGSATALEGLAQVALTTGEDERAALLLGAAAALREAIGAPLTGPAGLEDVEHRRGLADRLGLEALEPLFRHGRRAPLDDLLEGPTGEQLAAG